MRIRASRCSREGFQVKRVRTPAAVRLSRLVSPAGLSDMVHDLDAHGAGVWAVRRVRRLRPDHPDRFVGAVEYTHTVKVLYRPITRRGVWVCVYGRTAAGDLHLWSD